MDNYFRSTHTNNKLILGHHVQLKVYIYRLLTNIMAELNATSIVLKTNTPNCEYLTFLCHCLLSFLFLNSRLSRINIPE